MRTLASIMFPLVAGFSCLALVFVLTGCPAAQDAEADGAPPALDAADVEKVVRQYAVNLHATYADALAGAQELKTAVDAFCAEPSAAGLEACRAAWLKARPCYQQSEVGRFYDGPIDRAGGPEPDLNPWPLDEVFIDGVRGAEDAGFINDPSIPITPEKIRTLNGQGGEENIAAGWHAVEFMLWGQDHDAAGPGQRDHRDFRDDGPRPQAARRRLYLQTIAAMIADDLAGVCAAWAPETGAYRREFLAKNPTDALRCLITGAGTLAKGELHGERMLVPYMSKGQEDEHSCFSDTTHLDHLHNLLGVAWVWTGDYTSPWDGRKLEGLGVRDLVASRDERRAKAVDAELAAIEASLRDKNFAPFDQAILGTDTSPGRQTIFAAIKGLKRLDAELTRVASELGLDIVTALPE